MKPWEFERLTFNEVIEYLKQLNAIEAEQAKANTK